MIRTNDKKYIKEILNLLKEDNLISASGNCVDEDYLSCFFNNGFVFIEKSENDVIACFIGESLISDGFLLQYAVIKKEYRNYRFLSLLCDEVIILLKNLNIKYILSYAAAGIEKIAKRKGFIIGKKYTEIVKHI